jgi:hypothetical protein
LLHIGATDLIAFDLHQSDRQTTLATEHLLERASGGRVLDQNCVRPVLVAECLRDLEQLREFTLAPLHVEKVEGLAVFDLPNRPNRPVIVRTAFGGRVDADQNPAAN